MNYTVFDVEANGLLEDATEIHCLSYQIHNGIEVIERGSMTSGLDMRDFLLKQEMLVGHNIIRYDIPLLEKFLRIRIPARIFDTLAVSWYLYPERKKHGLEAWGLELGSEKVKITDWKGLREEEYIARCEGDVEINMKLFLRQKAYLEALYPEGTGRIVGYLNFKMACLRDQEKEKISLDVELCYRTKVKLEKVIEEKVNKLTEIMPAYLGNVIRTKPKIRTDSWFKFLAEQGLTSEQSALVTEVREKPSPTSHAQLKSWLDSLGWVPITFKLSKNTGKNVPQISLPFGQGICPSVKALYEKEPNLIELEGLFIAQHRLGIINSFLEYKDKNNKVFSSAHGFTNTLRLQHGSPIVNLPGVDKPYGEDIRGCLKVPDEEHIMCGADISGLEDNTKQHYIYFFDPEYVKQMRVPGFDPHLDIALLGKMITQEDADFYKAYDKEKEENKDFKPTEEEKERFKKIKKLRFEAKTVNFSATYGAGPPKIAQTLKKSVAEAKVLHTTYWNRNKAVKLTAGVCKVKEVREQKWLYNPMSGFWMYLKAEKDKFSTLNQSSGAYVFDTWVRKVVSKISPTVVVLQYHDELLVVCKKSERGKVEKGLKEAMEETNKEIKLNVEIGISISWGNNYAECH
jgi:hypothetical protein